MFIRFAWQRALHFKGRATHGWKSAQPGGGGARSRACARRPRRRWAPSTRCSCCARWRRSGRTRAARRSRWRRSRRSSPSRSSWHGPQLLRPEGQKMACLHINKQIAVTLAALTPLVAQPQLLARGPGGVQPARQGSPTCLQPARQGLRGPRRAVRALPLRVCLPPLQCACHLGGHASSRVSLAARAA
jgi:hypothetical protein